MNTAPINFNVNLPIVQQPVNGETLQTINARDLHRELAVPAQFKDWIARRINDYGFIDGSDFSSFLSESTGGRPTKEYALTLNMAKELAMVEKSEKGKQIRRYFIQREKESRQLTTSATTAISPVFHDCIAIAHAFGMSGNQALLSFIIILPMNNDINLLFLRL